MITLFTKRIYPNSICLVYGLFMVYANNMKLKSLSGSKFDEFLFISQLYPENYIGSTHTILVLIVSMQTSLIMGESSKFPKS